jgi:nitrate reductase (NAD(P)H)
MRDKMLIRSYTPTAPLLPAPREKEGRPNGETCDENEHQNDDEDKVTDGQGTFQLTVKTYFPTDEQPGGAMSNILDCVPIGEEVEIRGPTGEIVYNGNGKFVIEGKQRTFKRISLVLGGSGITPGYALIARIVLSGDDNETQIRVVDANKSEQDILLKDELDGFERKSEGKVKIVHVLSHSGDGWKGLKGHVNADILKENLFEPNEDSVVFLCGPPAMVQKAALPALRGMYLSCCHCYELTDSPDRMGIQGR